MSNRRTKKNAKPKTDRPKGEYERKPPVSRSGPVSGELVNLQTADEGKLGEFPPLTSDHPGTPEKVAYVFEQEHTRLALMPVDDPTPSAQTREIRMLRADLYRTSAAILRALEAKR